MIENTFRTFSTNFDVVVAAIEEAKDLATLTVDELMGSNLSHEARIDRNKDSTSENDFKSQVSILIGRDKGRLRGRGWSGIYGGHREDREEHEHESGSNNRIIFKNNRRFERTKVRCYYCNKFGHYARDCKKRIVDQGNQRANVSTDNTNSMFLTFHNMHESSDNVWLLDSDYSNHLKGNKSLVANLNQYMKTEVNLGTDKTMDIDGKEVVNILTKQGEPKKISEVYYVPGLRHNLISVGQLTQKGYKFIFQRKKRVIYDKPPRKQLIEKLQMTRNILFPIIMNYSDQVSSFTVSCSNYYWLWYFQFGHFHFSGLYCLSRNRWSEDYLPSKNLLVLVSFSSWERKKVKFFRREFHTEKRNLLSWCIMTCVDL